MRQLLKLGLASAVVAATLGTALAEPVDDELIIDGETIATKAPGNGIAPFDTLYSGWRLRTDETRAMEADDFDNPAFAFVEEGEAMWNTVEGSAGKSCASCHGDASETMVGVRAAMPKWNEKLGKPHTMETQINACRTENMEAEAWDWDDTKMLSMTAYVGLQSRGLPVAVQTDGPMTEWFEKGKEMYYTRTGQLNFSCASCHEANFDKMIRADHLSQGHVNGFPTYRLKTASLNSVQKRFKGCVRDTRAEQPKIGSDELLALEVYVAARGNGLSVETPSVRN